MEFPKLPGMGNRPGPGGRPRFPRRADADPGDGREQGPYSAGLPSGKTFRMDAYGTYVPTLKTVVIEDGWVEVHCFVRIEQAADVAAALRAAVPMGTRVERRGVRRNPRTGAFTADRTAWQPVR